MPPRPSVRAFTLIELLVVISVIAVLAALVMPAIAIARERANRVACGNNQKSLIEMCIAYSHDANGAFPVIPIAPGKPPVTSSVEAAQVTARSFEVLAATMNLSNALFRCRSASHPAPTIRPMTVRTTDVHAWGWTTAGTVHYAYDWAAPSSAAPSRILIADRDPRHHGDGAMVARGDGSVGYLKVDGTEPAGIQCCDRTGAAIPRAIANPDSRGKDDDEADATPDNIYDGNGDTAQPNDGWTIGGGSSRRTIVK
jgi:prepilin-type N-terminal cleavage/methylation domain-containing protein